MKVVFATLRGHKGFYHTLRGGGIRLNVTVRYIGGNEV